MAEDYWSVVETVWDTISVYERPEVFLDQFRQARPAVGHLFAAHWCQSEVNNGGFYQFFENPTGVLAPEAREGFLAIGLKEWARILEEAMTYFGTPYPRDHATRLKALKPKRGVKPEDRNPFRSLDDRFYQWASKGENRFEKMADKFARKIPD